MNRILTHNHTDTNKKFFLNIRTDLTSELYLSVTFLKFGKVYCRMIIY